MAEYNVRTEGVKAIFHGFCSWLYVVYHVVTRP